MKIKLLILITIITFSLFVGVPLTKSYFSDTEVISGNIFSTGTWENEGKEFTIELKKPLDSHTYYLGQEIQILWKVKNAHPHSDLTFKLYLLDENKELIEKLDMDNMECGPPSNSDNFEKWCVWTPTQVGNFIVKVESFDDDDLIGYDENEEFFTVEEKPGKTTKQDITIESNYDNEEQSEDSNNPEVLQETQTIDSPTQPNLDLE